MDGSRLSTTAPASQRASALPRPASRLPQPRPSNIPTPTPALRHVASTDGLRGRQLRPPSAAAAATVPRLRPSASRDQLKPAAAASALRKPQRAPGPPLSSQAALQGATRGGQGAWREPVARGPHTATVTAHHDDADAGDISNKLPQLTGSDEEGLPIDDLGDTASQGLRLSLSERTVETLAQLPSSPSFKRRGSNFYEPDSPFRPPSSRTDNAGSRPGSSYQSDGSVARSRSRPGSKSGPHDASYGSFGAPSSTRKSSLASLQGTSAKNITMTTRSFGYRPTSAASKHMVTDKVSSASSTNGAKTAGARPLRTGASINGLIKKSSVSSLDRGSSKTTQLAIRPPRKTSVASGVSSATSSGEDRNPSGASTASTARTVVSPEDAMAAVSASHKSSAALREQIARAKAAKRAASKIGGSDAAASTSLKSPLIPTDSTFDFGLSDDPFGQAKFERSNRSVMQSRIESARTSGRLNIAAMGLKQVPEEVLKMYDLESIGGHGGSWAESVDLTRFVAADNELETIDDAIFPDSDPRDFADDEDGRGHQFGGLESLDLHGNQLINLPTGLRRLQQLTSLNLANNKLANGSLEIIGQILPLRELKLGGNLFSGKLSSELASLQNLEIIDLKGNEVSGLPDGVERLEKLRVLNISENAFESLPFGALAGLPLIELLAPKNKLTGTLVDVDVETLPHLQALDVSSNQLTLLALGKLSMPSLLQCTISLNRLQALPDMGSWKSLLTLNASENSIAVIPDGFAKLGNLKHADFTSNDIRAIPPEIGRMDSLAMLRISGNPLRDKKFTSMTTEELKDSLSARLEPLTQPGDETKQLGDDLCPSGESSPPTSQTMRLEETAAARSGYNQSDDLATPPTSAHQSPVRARSGPQTPSSQTWPIKAGGVLDRASTESSSLHPVVCSKIAADQVVCEVRLQHNMFTTMPESLSFFADTLTTLVMSHNQLIGESYLSEQLDLLALKELTLSHNHITSLRPLVSHLRAPNLQKLDVSFNRIVSLPALRDAFPTLSILLASNNHLEDLDPNSVSGLQVVAADNNDIAHLNPRLGLLKLERLEVNGNRFRVPRWNVLERGTEATLRWLRGRVPVAEMAEWRAKYGEDTGEDEGPDGLD